MGQGLVLEPRGLTIEPLVADPGDGPGTLRRRRAEAGPAGLVVATEIARVGPSVRLVDAGDPDTGLASLGGRGTDVLRYLVLAPALEAEGAVPRTGLRIQGSDRRAGLRLASPRAGVRRPRSRLRTRLLARVLIDASGAQAFLLVGGGGGWPAFPVLVLASVPALGLTPHGRCWGGAVVGAQAAILAVSGTLTGVAASRLLGQAPTAERHKTEEFASAREALLAEVEVAQEVQTLLLSEMEVAQRIQTLLLPRTPPGPRPRGGGADNHRQRGGWRRLRRPRGSAPAASTVPWAGTCRSIIWRRATAALEEVELEAMWRGVLDDLEPEQLPAARFRLGAGDLLFRYTDGVVEQFADDEMSGFERIKDVIRRHAAAGAAVLVDEVLRSLEDFSSEQEDDITMLVLDHAGDGAVVGPTRRSQ